MRQRGCTTAVAAAALVLTGVASAAGPDVQERIVPGQAIGKIRIGMSLAQVKKVLGQPEAVIRRRRRSFTREWVEYSWNFTSWRVGFQVYRGKAEVVSIRSSIRGERTKEGIGYGTLATRVQTAYRTQCKPAWSRAGQFGPANFLGYGCAFRTGGRSTFFLVGELCGNVPSAGRCASKDTRWAVVEYGVLGPGEKLPFELGDFIPGLAPIE